MSVGYADTGSRTVLISKSGEYQITRFDTLLIQAHKVHYCYFPELVVKDGNQYVLERYDHKKNTLFYRYLGAAAPLGVENDQ